jgi:hypothetical protein
MHVDDVRQDETAGLRPALHLPEGLRYVDPKETRSAQARMAELLIGPKIKKAATCCRAENLQNYLKESYHLEDQFQRLGECIRVYSGDRGAAPV